MNSIIDSITCPITQLPMTEPVTGSDGQTYEKSAIINWLQRNATSPTDRNPMNIESLKLNVAIKFLCDKYHNGEFNNINVPTDNTSNNNEPIISEKKIDIYTHLKKNNAQNLLNFSFNCQNIDNVNVFPTDLILVIDRSGSMSLPVEAKDENGNKLENGMSVQDIVNHSAKTIVKTLDKNSRICIIIFDNNIEILYDLNNTNDLNKASIMDKIDNIKPRGQTNLWGAILEGINILNNRDDKTRNGAIFALTDGVPNISPARGEIETLKRLKNTLNFTSPIYTFGFGYSLKKDLLFDISKYGNGANGHIPDGSMIATVFCNFLGTILTTVALNFQIHIKTNKPEKHDLIMGDYICNHNENTNYTTYNIGNIQYQQSRDVVMNYDPKYYYKYYITYKIFGKSYKSEENIIDNINNYETHNTDVNNNYLRYYVIENLQKMINYNNISHENHIDNNVENIYKNIIETLKQNSNNKFIENLIETMEDQVKLALLNKTYFNKWGEFYIQQLISALKLQIKPNFKDKACDFGGELFTEIVDKASDIFDSLPPPKPSLVINNNNNNNNYRSIDPNNNYRSLPANMSAYNNVNGGCFHSDCTILMSDFTQKKLCDLKKNDTVISYDIYDNIKTSKIVCIVEIIISDKYRELVNLDNGLKITPWHPVKHEEEWKFPFNIKTPELQECKSIITLVLDNHHIGVINNHKCIMLGHNYICGILNHPYYGTDRVINDLKEYPSWNSGKIILNDKKIDKIVKLYNLNSPTKHSTFKNSYKSKVGFIL